MLVLQGRGKAEQQSTTYLSRQTLFSMGFAHLPAQMYTIPSPSQGLHALFSVVCSKRNICLTCSRLDTNSA